MDSYYPATSIDTPRTAERARAGVAATPDVEVIYQPRPTPVATIGEVVPAERSELASRVLNVVIAVVAMVLLAPVFLLVALAVKLSSRGPIFYMQTRVGIDRRWNRTQAMYDRRQQDLGGSVFTIYKFRSMYTDAETKSGAVWATRSDSRVTPVGKVLRQLRLDELPQLLNVLKGDMNIVGPRPERPSIFVRLRNDIAEYPMRQRAKPGITGWAQINHSYDSCLEDVRKKVQYDLEYLQRQSLAEDLKIMAKTVPVMIFKKGGW
jgi:lipopolysaccharide/colanic/teichoic acid biosynthesis glycosyltransferase